MVHDKERGTDLDRGVDRSQRCIHRYRAAPNGTNVLDLYAIHRSWIIGDIARTEEIVEMLGDIGERRAVGGHVSGARRGSGVESAGSQLGSYGVDRTQRGRGDAWCECRVDDERDDIAFRS